MSEQGEIYVEKDGAVACLVLNRPKVLNAINLNMFREIARRTNELEDDPEVRVLVLRAEGRAFTAGLDLKEAAEALLVDTTASGREQLRRMLLEFQECVSVFERCRKPIVAAVNGICYGAGVDLITACDVRLAAADAVFSVRETKIAMVADLGSLQRLPSIIGNGWTRELALTGRDFDAADALQMGLVTRVADDCKSLYDAAGLVAAEIAANSPLAVEGVKDVLNYNRDHGVMASLAYVAQKNAVLFHCDDLREAIEAFHEKRTPEFKGR